MGNTFGNIFKVTTFGESHGRAIGGIIDGCPSGVEIDIDYIQNELNRRKPGQSLLTTSRKEPDSVEFLSGLFEGKTTGTPIAFCIWNAQQRSQDYDSMKELFRPSHADYTYLKKYGIRDNRGGGRSSARETVSRVVAGALASQILKKKNITITAYTSAVGRVKADKPYNEYDFSNIEKNLVRCPDPEKADEMAAYIKELKGQGDSIGGTITCVIKGVDPGLGEPVFNKLNVALGAAVLSINAVKGFEFGSGFEVSKKGSELNDPFTCENGKIRTKTNNSGGIQGGISNGEDIYFKVAFKPIATILREQTTVDKQGNSVTFTAHGRHDTCVLPRAVPIVEAMAALTILDYYLMGNCKKI